MTTTHDGIEIKFLSKSEAWQMLEDAAQRELGISAKEFIEAWDSGKFDDNPDRPEVMNVAMLLGLIR
jgi:hypothetical protein